MASTADVARVARLAGQAGDNGMSQMDGGGTSGVVFDLKRTGYCARFVRQCHEVAMGLPAFGWHYASPDAKAMEAKLKANGCAIDVADRVPGDIIAINKDTGRYGHIGIYIGDGQFAENTSSTSRGPGTTISNILDVRHRITGWYRDKALDVAQPPDPNAPSDWAADAWQWAQYHGLLDGTRPLECASREELATALFRFHEMLLEE